METFQEEKENEIFQIFEANNLKWSTILLPFTRKCFNIRIIDNFQNDYDIATIRKINLESFLEDKIPVWNIIRKEIPYQRQIHPYKNTKYWVYSFQKQNLDLIAPIKQEIESIYIDKDEIKVVIKETCNNWNIYRLSNYEDIMKLKINDKIFSEVIKGEEIVTCPHCGRVLYIETEENK